MYRHFRQTATKTLLGLFFLREQVITGLTGCISESLRVCILISEIPTLHKRYT